MVESSAEDLRKPPVFAGHPFEKQLDILHEEIVSQIVDGQPLPNKYVYRKPWRRDAAMTAMVLEKTGRIGLIRDWILSLDDPFDRNNNGNEEPDNIGQSLYLIGCVADASHPSVKTFVDIAHEHMDGDGILTGLVDFGRHRVYAQKWLKLGLEKCGMDASWVMIPNEPDDYNDIFWMDGSRNPSLASEKLNANYPYLTWAKWHKGGRKFTSDDIPAVSPMTWEAHASEADYEAIRPVNSRWADEKICYPHTWHAAEMFLLLCELR